MVAYFSYYDTEVGFGINLMVHNFHWWTDCVRDLYTSLNDETMGDVGTDSLRNLIKRWNISFDCPSCSHKIEVSDMTASTNKNRANIVGWVHRTCMCENPKKSHVCMGCGSMSSHRPSKVKYKDNCKYMRDRKTL